MVLLLRRGSGRTYEGVGVSRVFQVLFYGLSDHLWTCLGSKPRPRSVCSGNTCIPRPRAGGGALLAWRDRAVYLSPQGRGTAAGTSLRWRWGAPPRTPAPPATVLTGRGLRSRCFRPGSGGVRVQPQGEPRRKPPCRLRAGDAQQKDGCPETPVLKHLPLSPASANPGCIILAPEEAYFYVR